ncbi:glycosyltransferase [Rhodococcus globerulus]|uniref:glycosyltransferase n=1 Tax=Rhodococcus globerulus TaxID=33008 RepID=UPI003555F4FA|nr:glycosyltransferase family 4 protein [Rhodococcus globerulus]
MRIAFVGGVPNIMGGGGLEVQMAETALALRSSGHSVAVWGNDLDSEDIDVLHIYGADPASWNYLRNWTRNRVPVVVSPIAVFDTPFAGMMERWISRLKIGPTNTANMRRGVVAAADHLIALHPAERDWICRSYDRPATEVSVIPNGSSAISSSSAVSGESYICVVGTVGARKGQLDLLGTWNRALPDLRVIGGLTPNWKDAHAFEQAIAARVNATWVGALPRQDVWHAQHAALATISFSVSEGESLALLDSLRLGRPVLVRKSSSALQMKERYGSQVRIFDGRDSLVAQINELRDSAKSDDVVRPPSWDDVALELQLIYRSLLPGKD